MKLIRHQDDKSKTKNFVTVKNYCTHLTVTSYNHCYKCQTTSDFRANQIYIWENTIN